jgi:hypothetical protein
MGTFCVPVINLIHMPFHHISAKHFLHFKFINKNYILVKLKFFHKSKKKKKKKKHIYNSQVIHYLKNYNQVMKLTSDDNIFQRHYVYIIFQ